LSKQFSDKIINWYLQNKRDLPWRNSKDPYTIWLSEILLQQTRVEQGLPYFNNFINTYPTLQDFFKASEDEILKMWQGLGYYSRARNMMSCAKTVVEEYGGEFPDSYDALVRLKGIGKYTAAAMASICFNESVSVIDGNVYRVLARIFGIEEDINDSKTYKIFFQKAQQLIDSEKPDIFNQSMMEFGALHCTPRNMDCESCLFSENCFANLHDLQAVLPVKSKKVKKRIRYFNYYMISYQHKVLIKKRLAGDIWNGLYDFLLIEKDSKETFDLSENTKLGNYNLEKDSSSLEYKHILTHQTIFARFFRVELSSMNEFEVIKNDYSMLEIEKSALKDYPIPVLIDNFLKNDYF
jgi:A/G-specific adenine glycosylase